MEKNAFAHAQRGDGGQGKRHGDVDRLPGQEGALARAAKGKEDPPAFTERGPSRPALPVPIGSHNYRVTRCTRSSRGSLLVWQWRASVIAPAGAAAAFLTVTHVLPVIMCICVDGIYRRKELCAQAAWGPPVPTCAICAREISGAAQFTAAERRIGHHSRQDAERQHCPEGQFFYVSGGPRSEPDSIGEKQRVRA